MAFENSIRVLQGFARKQVADAKRKLKGSKVADSIKVEVVGDFESEPMVKFTMPLYGAFVDTGVTGTKNKRKQLNSSFANAIFGFNKQPAFSGSFKMIPPSAIMGWIKSKGIKGRSLKTGRFITDKSLSFAFATSIYQKGLDGKGFFSEPLGLNLGKMYNNLEGAYAQDLKDNLELDKYFV